MRSYTPIRTLALCAGIAVFLVGFMLSVSGCAEPGHVKCTGACKIHCAHAHGYHHGQAACAKAGCEKTCKPSCRKTCSAKMACKPGCTKPCCAKMACKPGCTKPCCAMKKAGTPDKPQTDASPEK